MQTHACLVVWLLWRARFDIRVCLRRLLLSCAVSGEHSGSMIVQGSGFRVLGFGPGVWRVRFGFYP